MNLPKIKDQIDSKSQFVNGRPDGGYALRILILYRAKCNEKWMVEGLDAGTTEIYNMMNEHQDLRAKELDKAIDILTKG